MPPPATSASNMTSPSEQMFLDLLRGFVPDAASLKSWRDVVRGGSMAAAGGASPPCIVSDLVRASSGEDPMASSSSSAAANPSNAAPDANEAEDKASGHVGTSRNEEETIVSGTGPRSDMVDRSIPAEEEEEGAWRHGYRLFLLTHCLHRILSEVALPVLARAEAAEAAAKGTSSSGRPEGTGKGSTANLTTGAPPDAKKGKTKAKGEQQPQHKQHPPDEDVSASSPPGTTSADDLDRLSLVLTTLAFNVASFVEQHAPGPRRPSRTGGSEAAAAVAGPPTDASLLLNEMAESSRPVVSRAVLFATAAALTGMRLLLVSGDAESDDDGNYDDDAGGRWRDHEEGSQPTTTGRVRNRSVAAGTIALEILLGWNQDPIDREGADPNHISSSGGGGHEDAKNDRSFGEDLAWYETRSMLQDWLRDSPESDADMLTSRRLVGEPLRATDLPASVVADQDWTREIELWNAIGGASESGAGLGSSTPAGGESDAAARALKPPPSQPARLTRTAAAASSSLSKAGAGPPAASKGTKKRPSSPPKTASKKRRGVRTAAASAAPADRTGPDPRRSPAVALRAPASTLVSQLGELLRGLVLQYEANRWSMDGRLPLKKWTPVALQWQMPGAANLMTMCLHLLKCVERRRSSISGSTTIDVTDPGLKIVLARRLLRLLSSLAMLGGSRAPSSSASMGGLDELVKILGPAIASSSDAGGPVAAPSKKKSKKAAAAQAAVDLRSLATTVAHQLVAAIASCQPEDVIFRPFSSTCISVTLAVQDLARIIPGALEDDSDRIECAAAAYAFQMDCTSDAHFSAFCVQKLAKSLSRHGNEAAQDRLLARPLPRPRSTPSSPPRKSRSSPAGTYGGVFDDGTDNLTVFLRAMHPNCYDGLVTRLVELAESCYRNVGLNPPSDAQMNEHRRKKRRKDDCSQSRCVPAGCTATFCYVPALTIVPLLF